MPRYLKLFNTARGWPATRKYLLCSSGRERRVQAFARHSANGNGNRARGSDTRPSMPSFKGTLVELIRSTQAPYR